MSNSNNQQLLDPTPQDQLHLPYMKLLPKVHTVNWTDLLHTTTLQNLLADQLLPHTASWTTSNPSRLLRTEVDNILRLKDFFKNETSFFL